LEWTTWLFATKEWKSLKAQAKASQSGYHPQKLGVAANNSNVFGLGSGLGYNRLLARGLHNRNSVTNKNWYQSITIKVES
jgi:hypothetical protein